MIKKCSCGNEVFYQVVSYNRYIKVKDNNVEKLYDEEQFCYNGLFCSYCGAYYNISVPVYDEYAGKETKYKYKEVKKWV